MQPSSYENFIQTKLSRVPPTGLSEVPALSEKLFPFQRDLVSWALKRGRCAIFASTGLGKTRMQLEWARHIGKDVLIVAPLAVSHQTVKEGESIGVAVNLCKVDSDVKPGVNITNYEKLHKFDCSRFGGVVLDESSIIKHHDAKTLQQLMELFRDTPFKLCATATPSPNDYTELGTHAEFLGICTRAEMLAEYFCHDGGETQTWRLKRHGVQHFWRWVSSWGALVRMPSDLGYSDDGYVLPPLSIHHHSIPADRETLKEAGLLFAKEATDLTERRQARKASVSARVKQCADLVNKSKDPWIVWCDLNAEGEALRNAIPLSIEVKGADSSDAKEKLLDQFSDGEARVLISKPSICGFGLNWQHCANVAFVGVTDSWEAYYQAVRRCWRFGQKKPVNVHVFASEVEGSVIKNLQRKEADALRMSDELSRETRDALKEEIFGTVRKTNSYQKTEIKLPNWL